MAGYFDVFISGSPKDNEIFPSGDDKARIYLEKFFNISENECHSYDFYVDAIVNEKVTYYSLLFRRNVVGTRTNGYFALTIRMNGGYHLNIKLIQNVLYHIYERYIEGKIIEEKEENKIKSYKYKVESLSNFFTKENKESIVNYLNERFKDTASQFGEFQSNKIPFSKTPSVNRNLYVTSADKNVLLNELAKTWTLHTYSDYDKNKELETQINSLGTKLSEVQSTIKVKDNQLDAMNSKIVSLSNELEELKKDRDKKASDLQSEKKKNEQLEKENKELKNNPKNLFERDVREMLIEILNGQDSIKGLISNNKGNTVAQILGHQKPKKKQDTRNSGTEKMQDGENQKSGSVKFPHKIRKYIPWLIALVSVVMAIGMFKSSDSSNDSEQIAKLKKTIEQRVNEIISLKEEKTKLQDYVKEYELKIDSLNKEYDKFQQKRK
ncbi:MAG: hypothetical protein IKY22_01250 [Bacteroidales bacterium]|nr:hypothetical protein [Bacteroidales bacterium]